MLNKKTTITRKKIKMGYCYLLDKLLYKKSRKITTKNKGKVIKNMPKRDVDFYDKNIISYFLNI